MGVHGVVEVRPDEGDQPAPEAEQNDHETGDSALGARNSSHGALLPGAARYKPHSRASEVPSSGCRAPLWPVASGLWPPGVHAHGRAPGRLRRTPGIAAAGEAALT